MSSIAELMIEQGRIAAAARAASGQIWGRTVENIAQVPSQVAQQQREKQQFDLQRQELNMRLQAQGQQIQAGVQAQKETGVLDQLFADPDIYTAEGTINREGLQKRLGATGMSHLWPKVATIADTLDESSNKILDQKAKLADTHRETLGKVALQLEAAGYEPGASHLAFTGLAKAGILSTPQAQQYLQLSQPAQIKAIVTTWLPGTEAGKPKITMVPEGATPLDERTGKPLAGFTVVPKPPTQAELAADLASSDPTKRSRAEIALKAMQAPAAATAAEAHRHNLATEAAANPLAALSGGGTGTAGGAPMAGGATGLTGDDFLKTLPPNVASEVKAYAEGRRPFPAGFALKSPYFQSLIQMVGQYDPTFDAVNYNARSKTRNDFTSGKSAQTINALNTVTQHLDKLSTSADALKNSWSPTYNTVANFLSRQAGSPVVTNFETDKKAVVDELTRAWRQAGGSEGDIKSWSQVLDASNSPDQLHGAISQMGQLLEGKLSALEAQYQQGMGTSDTSGMKVVTPAARAVLQKLEQKGTSGTEPQQRAIPGIAGGMAESTDGGKTWKRIK